MLEYLRNASQSFIGKAILTIFMGLIIVSFGIWGIADVFRGSVSNQAASVGGRVITTDQYRLAFQQQLTQYSRMLKTALTAQQARSLGLDAVVLQKLESEAALDVRASQLGLALSDEQVAAMVRTDPNFLDESGAFNRATFDQILQQNDLTEASFFAQQRAFYERRQIERALTDDASAPKALIETLAKIDGQTRAIDYFTLSASSVGDVPAPSDAVLQKFFEVHKASYRAPEYRALTIVEALPEALAKPGEVGDDEVKALYDKDKATRFTDPPKRHVEQIVFPNDAEAAAALAKIKGGESFDDLAKERNLKPADTDLGVVTPDALFDKAVADAAFALPEGGVSDVVKSQFGPVLLRASQISPGGVKTLDEVSAQLKNEIAVRRAEDDIANLHDKVEDARVAGKSVAEAAKDAGLTAKTFDAVDATGKDKSGAAAPITQAADVVKAAFASDVGGDDPPVQTKDRGLIWFDVTKIEPAHDRPLAFAGVHAHRYESRYRSLGQVAMGDGEAL